MSAEILRNLGKLEPYIRQIRPDLLKLFVLPENLDVIMRSLDCFAKFNATYALILEITDAVRVGDRLVNPR